MPYDAILNGEIEVDDAITQSLMQKIKDNFDFLFGVASGGPGGVSNGSFDVDADSNGVPDNWSTTAYAGGTIARDTVDPAHGVGCLKAVHPGGVGNGGGYADSDYIAMNENYPFSVQFLNKCSQVGVKVQIIVRYFSEAKADLSADETLYSEAVNNPTAWTLITSGTASPPAAAQYCKIRVVGGFTDTDPGSSTDIYFDGLRMQIFTNAQEFTSGSTDWVKPHYGSVAIIQMWAGGASGGRGPSGAGRGGGGGGEYARFVVLLSSLSDTETVVIGAGGAAITASDVDGNDGGDTSFGSYATVGGGEGCNGSTGGPGGDVLTSLDIDESGGDGGDGSTGSAATAGVDTQFAGAGGGGGSDGSSPDQSGGTSTFGGNGGTGAFDANDAGDGVVPGGGGGGSETGDSGAGGDGYCLVSVF